jgi:hypothetical protein
MVEPSWASRMGRRYLLRDEAEATLRRGKTVECFLGACDREGRRGVRYLILGMAGEAVEMSLYESEDVGRQDFIDVYEFGPLDPKVVSGDPDQIEKFASFEECIADMTYRWPGSVSRLVNEGVVQEEYRDFIARRSA